jgi:hypothetical protein
VQLLSDASSTDSFSAAEYMAVLLLGGLASAL